MMKIAIFYQKESKLLDDIRKKIRKEACQLDVGRRIEGDTNSKLFFQLFSRRLRSAFCKCIMLSKMLHTAGIDFSFETQKAIDPVVRSTATRCI